MSIYGPSLLGAKIKLVPGRIQETLFSGGIHFSSSSVVRCTMIGNFRQDQNHCMTTEDVIGRKITVAVEGNIGSGKTTLLKFFKQNPLVEVIEEPVKKWQNISGNNLLEQFYTDCKRWSYLFESYALLTLMQIHKKPHNTPIKMIERSVYSGYYCFEHNLCKSGMMSSVEHSTHEEWFNWITTRDKPELDLIVYLRTSPEKCMERIKQRCRSEETSLPIELLNALHERHEDWLIRKCFPVPAPVVVVDGNKSLEDMYTFYKENGQCLLGIDTLAQGPQTEQTK